MPPGSLGNVLVSRAACVQLQIGDGGGGGGGGGVGSGKADQEGRNAEWMLEIAILTPIFTEKEVKGQGA